MTSQNDERGPLGRDRVRTDRHTGDGADRVQRTTHELLGAALRYARLGWPVVPLLPRGKRPILPDWTNAASTDRDVIRGWWARWPDANVGIATGPRSGLAVLDLDPRSGGAESLTELETRVGLLPGTAMVVTGSDGVHFYYRHPGVKVTSRAHSLGRGLDVKADGGQVVAPPSIHPTGQRYVWSGNVDGLFAGDVAGFVAPWPTSQLTPAEPAPTPSAPRVLAATAPMDGSGGAAQVTDRWSAQTDWSELLEPAGWRCCWDAGHGERRWVRPGKTDSGWSAVSHDGEHTYLHVFTSNSTFDPDASLSKFQVFAHLHHGGDQAAAWRAIAPPLDRADPVRLAEFVRDGGTGQFTHPRGSVAGRLKWAAGQVAGQVERDAAAAPLIRAAIRAGLAIDEAARIVCRALDEAGR
ncbi:bifunctional DNA primase/polymerase [Parafrankia sp. FMc2]|uniref:bifunctional DNA primase/polymerase n=1 Tax=Parafrankia sp. FMc2 TaxID=3233196 RepID=UPI0034D6FF9E